MDKNKIRDKCKIAINNILKEGTTDVEIFEIPFELEYLKNEQVKNDIIKFVTDAIMNKEFDGLKIHKLGYVLVPKKNLCDFRKCALIDIVDEITYLTLVLCIADEIERARINKSKKRIFSYRYKVNGDYIFDHKYHFTAFRNEVERKSKLQTNKVVVECDISNFYDRVNIHRIESSLLSLDNVDNGIVSLINQTLLFWANRDSYGLPVGSNASRLLAETALINIDQILLSHNVDFCRFVDDYRIFTKDAQTAHSHLNLLIQCLSREGLFINVQKTNVKDISKLSSKVNIVDEAEIVSLNTEKFDSTIENNDEAIRTNNIPKIIRGYNGIVPTKFRKLTNSEIVKLGECNIMEELNKLNDSTLVEPKELIVTMRAIVSQKKFDTLCDISYILKKYPQLIPYFIDCINKFSDQMNSNKLREIKENFKKWYSEANVPEYILIYLTRLFTIDNNIEDKIVLLDAFRNLNRVYGDYIGRALLGALNTTITRAEALEIREYYIRADIWEKRQILRIIQNKLPEGEKQAFFKDVLIHNSDIFINYIASNKPKFINIAKKEVADRY